MRCEKPGAPPVRLAYCLNLHPAEDLDGLLDGIRTITTPLAQAVAGDARPFGVGLYLPASVAFELDEPAGARGRHALGTLLRDEGLDPFTLNAFPFGGFHRPGLKADVFRPTWADEERLRFTTAAARLLVLLAPDPAAEPERHLSISTHTGGFGTHVASEAARSACARNLARAVAELARLERDSGWRIVLSLEAEPRANAGDTRALHGWRRFVREAGESTLARELAIGADAAQRLFERHFGTCLDTCHAAVEFERPADAVARSIDGGALGKVQFTSALAVVDPDRNAAARARLVELAEPVYLHQVTGRSSGDPTHTAAAADLPELAHELASEPERWLACDEWRCHFHVPVDLRLGASDAVAPAGLGTTREHADRTLDEVLGAADRLGTGELHVELETYTWNVLPIEARGAGGLVGGLAREYEHVLARLDRNGWRPAPDGDPGRRK